jgi:hypothetical protein
MRLPALALALLMSAASPFDVAAQGSAALPSTLGPPGATVYVFASRANLRAQPQAAAAVLAQPVTNTALKLLAQAGEWCEVETAAASAMPGAPTASTQRGFIACSLLRQAPLTLAGVQAELDAARRSGRGVLDWSSRSFWVAPGLLRITQVGRALEATHITREIADREISGGKALRFKVPEFEAMKQRLASGVLVAPEALEPVPMQPVAAQGDPSTAVAAAAHVHMPPIQTSLFSADQVPVLDTAIRYNEETSHRALLLVEALSARNAAPFQAVVTQPAVYALGPGAGQLAQSGPRFIRTAGPLDVIIGVWDVGTMEVTFGKDAFLHGVTVRGEPTRQKVLGLEVGLGHEYGCGGSARVLPRDVAVPGFASAKAALVQWVGTPMPGGAAARARVKSRKFSGAEAADLVVTQEIDLNNDGIADFFVMQGRWVPQISADGVWSAVFGNIAGQWQLLSYDKDEDCT